MDSDKGLSLFFQIAGIILAALSTIVAALMYFNIKSDNLPPIIQSLLSIPFYFYIIALLILIILYLTKKKNIGSGIRVAAFYRELTDINEIEYNGVKWTIRAPPPIQFEIEPEYLRRIVNSIDVKVPPKCPKCGLELEQSKNWLFGYTWKCIDCGFTKKNKDSYYVESERAQKICKRDLESEIKSKFG